MRFSRLIKPHSLFRLRAFRLFWLGETISSFGSQVTAFALPIIAALTLQATPLQMGLLSFLAFAPMLILTLFAGVLVDRRPRRPILIWTSLGQSLLLATIPLATFLHLLQLTYLYGIAFLSGSLSVFFEVAYQAYLPSLVAPEQMVEGNSRLETSHSLAQISGPSLATGLVQILSAPYALLVDAISFLVSAFLLWQIKTSEPPRAPSGNRPMLWREIVESLDVVFHKRLLRSVATCNAIINLCSNAISSILVLYIVRQLHIPLLIYGVILAIGNSGSLPGSLATSWISRRFGSGTTISGAVMTYCLAGLLLPLAGYLPGIAPLLLLLCWFCQNAALMIFNITQVSLRQQLIPIHMQGRLNASMRFLICSALPLGSLIGGILGQAIGLLPTITLAALALFCTLPFAAIVRRQDITKDE